ncbi:hypothetical protein [Clostridium estertheticum]|nr:hypothetical protein [Clostridium estertheticum]
MSTCIYEETNSFEIVHAFRKTGIIMHKYAFTNKVLNARINP